MITEERETKIRGEAVGKQKRLKIAPKNVSYLVDVYFQGYFLKIYVFFLIWGKGAGDLKLIVILNIIVHGKRAGLNIVPIAFPTVSAELCYFWLTKCFLEPFTISV